MSKLPNCVLRWRHLTWPRDLTWYDLGPKFLHNMRKGWLNSYAKFGGAARRHFSAICEKPMGGGHICAPPGRARVNVKSRSVSISASQITLESNRTRKSRPRSLTLFDLSWPRLTLLGTDDLWKPWVPNTYLVLHVHMNIANKNGALLASYRLKCATEHIFRLACPQLWRHRLTLAGTGHFASFHGTGGGGGYDPPLTFHPWLS